MKTLAALILALLLVAPVSASPDACMAYAEFLRDVAAGTIAPDPARGLLMLAACRDDLTPEEAERQRQRLADELARSGVTSATCTQHGWVTVCESVR